MHVCIGWKDVLSDVARTNEPQISFALIEMMDNGPVIVESICIHEDFSWQLHIQQKIIHPESLEVTMPSLLNSVSALKHIISYVDSCNICCGNPDGKFHPLVVSRNGKFMDSSGLCIYWHT